MGNRERFVANLSQSESTTDSDNEALSSCSKGLGDSESFEIRESEASVN